VIVEIVILVLVGKAHHQLNLFHCLAKVFFLGLVLKKKKEIRFAAGDRCFLISMMYTFLSYSKHLRRNKSFVSFSSCAFFEGWPEGEQTIGCARMGVSIVSSSTHSK
jgi:hypothetical protein